MGPFESTFAYNDVVELSVSSDGKHLATSYRKGPVGIHLFESGVLVRLLIADARVGGGIAFSPDGTQLAASAGRSGESLNLFAVATGDLVARYPAIPDAGYLVSWQPARGQRIASTGFQTARVTVWDPVTGIATRTLDDPVQRLYGLGYSPDGRWLATVATGLGVVVRDAESDRVRAVAARHPPEVIAAAWSSDSFHLATAQAEQARVWYLADLASGR
jgi:WD40 repeat protein